ncbi:MAG TPA: hypothetical protein VFC19_20485 [Candidatus Limnocylindrales bacterium]|nr:hypothetical protein [Candidatus Limnocylindrales bacterium]
MGALVTLDLAADAPQHDLPWIITFGPLDEDEDWEPVVCGPYERPHAMAIAQHLIADADLMAVVEPLLPATSLPEIREEIEKAQRTALDAIEEVDDSLDTDLEFEFDDEVDDEEDDGHAVAEEPTPDEIRAGFARISARLTSG